MSAFPMVGVWQAPVLPAWTLGAGFDTSPPRAAPINIQSLRLLSQLNQTLMLLKLSVYKTNLCKCLIPPNSFIPPNALLPWHVSRRDSLSWPRGQQPLLPVAEEMKSILLEYEGFRNAKALETQHVIYKRPGGREASDGAGNWGQDGNTGPLQMAAASLGLAQGLVSAWSCRPSRLTSVSCYILLTSLLQGTSLGLHVQVAKFGSERSCSGGRMWAANVWGVSQFITKGEGGLGHGGGSEKFLKEGSSDHG